MATYKRIKSGGTQSEVVSNSVSPVSSGSLSNPSPSQGINNNAPKYGTLVPNRIFVGGISNNTTEAELSQLFSKYGNVKATKIIADRAGVSKGYGFVTFDSEDEVKLLIQDANNIVLKERRLNIAPAIKKQIDVFVGQPINRTFDASSPPPTTQNLYFHNGVPYTFHNGTAFFTSTAHQPIAAMPPGDTAMYPSFGPNQNSAPAAYGGAVLVPAPPQIFMPQNYTYQSLPMANGGPTPFIYAGSGSPNGSSGSTDNSPLSNPLPTHFYAAQYAAQEAFYPQPVYVSYSYATGEYEPHDSQTTDDRSSSVSSPRSEISDRSSNLSPANRPQPYLRVVRNSSEPSRPNSEASSNAGTNNSAPNQSTSESQVPVVSWQNIQDRDERLLYIRDGRRAFHPVIPPPPPPTASPMLLYQQPPYSMGFQSPNSVSAYQHSKPCVQSNQRQNFRGRCSKIGVSTNNIPFIPKFPACFNNNNNNPLVMNNNFYDKKSTDVVNRQQRGNGRSRGIGRGTFRTTSPPPNPSNSSPPQMMQYERSMMLTNPPPRWCSNSPQVSSHHQIKRFIGGKRQNGSIPNLSLNSSGSIRMNKKGNQDCMENVAGGGGDAQPVTQLTSNNLEITSKMQSMALGGTS